MSGINQIQMSFVPGEDRILLRMNTMDASGFQFWLTRRYVKLLWPVLLGMLAKDEKISTQASEQAKREVLSFQHQQAAENMDYSQQFQEPSSDLPLGNQPLLLAKIAVKDHADGSQALCMHPETGQGVEIVLNQTLLHSICKLLQDTVAKAEWDMDLSQSLQSSIMPTEHDAHLIN